MAISTARASYQPTANIQVGQREPFACPSYQATLRGISAEALRCGEATTQAAYLLRLNTLRSLIKSLG